MQSRDALLLLGPTLPRASILPNQSQAKEKHKVTEHLHNRWSWWTCLWRFIWILQINHTRNGFCHLLDRHCIRRKRRGSPISRFVRTWLLGLLQQQKQWGQNPWNPWDLQNRYSWKVPHSHSQSQWKVWSAYLRKWYRVWSSKRRKQRRMRYWRYFSPSSGKDGYQVRRALPRLHDQQRLWLSWC